MALPGCDRVRSQRLAAGQFAAGRVPLACRFREGYKFAAMPTLTKEQEAEADEVDRIFEEAFKELEAHGSKRLPPDDGKSMQVYVLPRLPKSNTPPPVTPR